MEEKTSQQTYGKEPHLRQVLPREYRRAGCREKNQRTGQQEICVLIHQKFNFTSLRPEHEIDNPSGDCTSMTQTTLYSQPSASTKHRHPSSLAARKIHILSLLKDVGRMAKPAYASYIPCRVSLQRGLHIYPRRPVQLLWRIHPSTTSTNIAIGPDLQSARSLYPIKLSTCAHGCLPSPDMSYLLTMHYFPILQCYDHS